MALSPATKDFLRYLRDHPGVRAGIAAPRDRTLLYAGEFFRPAWRDIAVRRQADPALRSKVTLPEVLAALQVPDAPHPTLLAWAETFGGADTAGWPHNGFVVWRALSGLFAANATGQVSFYVGSGVTRETRVFAATEIGVLARNPAVDARTRDVLAYFQRCLANHQAHLNFAFVTGPG